MSIWKEDTTRSDEIRRAKQRIYQHRYYMKNREKLIKKNTEYEKYRDKSEYSKKWYAEHKEYKKAYKREHYKKNAEKIRAKERKRYQKNKDAINARRRELYALKKAKEKALEQEAG